MTEPKSDYSIITDDWARSCFGRTYAEACNLFTEAAGHLGLEVVRHDHPLRAPDGGGLATHAVRVGSPTASRLVVLISGTHGLEGLAGSGCQVAWLRSDAPRTLPPDVAVLLIHMLNPWGSAWRRRQTEDNVDLNRNFQPFTEPLPRNEFYSRVHHAIALRDPADWARGDAELATFRKAQGERAYAAAVFGGQYEQADGVGFGGHAPTWSNQTLHRILDEQAEGVRQTAVIDIHTGLGPYGHGVLLATDARGSAELELSRALYGPGVIPFNHEAKTPYAISGDLYSGVRRHLPGTVAALGLEFGTQEPDLLYQLQIDDCRTTDPRDITAYDEGVRDALEKFFYPASADWLQLLCLRTLQCVGLAVRRLK